MYCEIIFKLFIVVALFLTFIFCWFNGNPDDYSFMDGIIGKDEKERHEKDIHEGMNHIIITTDNDNISKK